MLLRNILTHYMFLDEEYSSNERQCVTDCCKLCLRLLATLGNVSAAFRRVAISILKQYFLHPQNAHYLPLFLSRLTDSYGSDVASASITFVFNVLRLPLLNSISKFCRSHLDSLFLAPNLLVLHLHEIACKVPVLTVSHPTLRLIRVSHSSFNSIDFHELPLLEFLEFSDSMCLDSFILSKCITSLHSLSLNYCSIEKVFVPSLFSVPAFKCLRRPPLSMVRVSTNFFLEFSLITIFPKMTALLTVYFIFQGFTDRFLVNVDIPFSKNGCATCRLFHTSRLY
ncbi:hypothetical protein RCL1_008485 [Eukaryota sp. TZLM3-RCL]